MSTKNWREYTFCQVGARCRRLMDETGQWLIVTDDLGDSRLREILDQINRHWGECKKGFCPDHQPKNGTGGTFLTEPAAKA